ncbi:MAG: sigma-70 family RNA polymerase sigma factor [Pleurocapsa sp. SU_196_0]|nr:sigma-70 family RNA polymerase sigma factor [Pleurocapsa sp. SU_196_0]
MTAFVPGVSTSDDLADAIQEVFSRAFSREARLAYDPTRDYAPYLCMVARNVVDSNFTWGSTANNISAACCRFLPTPQPLRAARLSTWAAPRSWVR